MFEKEKQEIIDYSLKMIEKGLTRSTGGNVSIYMRDHDVMLISPSSVEYDQLKVDDIVEMKLDGTQLSARHYKPSSEWYMHAIVYKNRKDINAMFHAHSMYAMTLSTLGKPLPAIDYLIGFSGSHEVPIARYASYGSKELAEESMKHLKDTFAVLLQNHGINTIGETISKAWTRLELLEMCAEMYWRAKSIGEPKIIDKKEMMKMVEIFKTDTYGSK